MSPRHLFALSTVLALSACSTLPTTTEPPEFSQTPEALRKKYPARRSLGVIDLYAREIRTISTDSGTSYQASGGAHLIKSSQPPIQATAPSILVTPEAAELRGMALVIKRSELLIAESDDTLIRIDGVQLFPEGPHSFKRIARTKVSLPLAAPETPAEPEPVPEPELVRPQPKRKPLRKPTAPTPPTLDRAHLLELMREPT